MSNQNQATLAGTVRDMTDDQIAKLLAGMFGGNPAASAANSGEGKVDEGNQPVVQAAGVGADLHSGGVDHGGGDGKEGKTVKVNDVGIGVPTASSSSENDVVVGGRDCDDSQESLGSWAEQVEQEVDVVTDASSDGGFEKISQFVRDTVIFGGFGGSVPESVVPGKGILATHVKTANALGLRGELLKIGIKMPKAAAWHIALVTNSAATMPVFFRDGVSKLRTFAVLGDSAMVSAAAAGAIADGKGLVSAQTVRSTVLTESVMRRAFARSQFKRYITVAAGISFEHSKTGSTALEAIVGVVAYYRSPADVRVLMSALGLKV